MGCSRCTSTFIAHVSVEDNKAVDTSGQNMGKVAAQFPVCSLEAISVYVD